MWKDQDRITTQVLEMACDFLLLPQESDEEQIHIRYVISYVKILCDYVPAAKEGNNTGFILLSCLGCHRSVVLL